MVKPKERPPFPICTTFPSKFDRALYKSYNALDNRIWPVKPIFFGASLIAFAAIHYQKPHNFLLNTIPFFGESLFAKGGRVALAAICSSYFPVFLLRFFLRLFFFSYKGYLFEDPKKPSIATKFWVPPLKDTVEKYLLSIRHLHTKEEYESILLKAKDFLENEGKKLQGYAWLYSLFSSNYVTPFWEKYAYWFNRGCLLISSSVAHIDLVRDRPATQAVRAAHVIYIEMLSQLGIDRQRFSPLGEGLLCSSHYDRLYAVTRVPGEGIDHLQKHGISSHVVVLFNGGIYKVETCDERRRMYTLEELSDIMSELLQRANTKVEGASGRVPALTHDERIRWAQNRKKFFLDHPVNKEALQVIESAAFVVILDEREDYDYQPERPELLSSFMRSMLTGNGVNRWVDKSLNYAIARNSRCGGTTEHSIGDGSEFDHVMENFVRMDTVILKYPPLEEQLAREAALNVREAVAAGLRLAEKIPISVDEEMDKEIERKTSLGIGNIYQLFTMFSGEADKLKKCYSSYIPLRDDVDMASTTFIHYGKGLIKKFGISPDAFVQMAIQLANYRDQGRFVLTYEAASARFFSNSRTETLRTVTDESCSFVIAMLETNRDNSACANLLKTAADLHTQRNRECMVNKAVDRHLFVLYLLSQGTGISSPFLSHYIQQPWLLSTSHVPNVTNTMKEDEHPEDSWLGASFAAVAKEGYGVCYRFAGNHSIYVHISSYYSASNTDSTRFRKELIQALYEMSELFA